MTKNIGPYGIENIKVGNSPKLHKKQCPRCRSDALPHIPEGWDSSIPAYLCINESCNYSAESFKFYPEHTNVPLGQVLPFGSLTDTKWEVIQSSKRRRMISANRKPSTFGQRRSASFREQKEIPDFPNSQPDTELESLVREHHGYILNITDDNPNSDDESISYNYSYGDE